jgi:endonuclease/exonuclease/phosphatase family metal-dependent hydrolase
MGTGEVGDAHSRQLWCEPVGPAAFGEAPPMPATSSRGDLLIIGWNVAVGAGDVERLVRTLEEQERKAGRGEPDFVLLLQETYRAGTAVPTEYSASARFPRRIAHGSRQHRDIESLAAKLGMHFVYVPSMRNGGFVRGEQSEDRGNAVLSTRPLREPTAIELPIEHQRRVAVAATLDASGLPLTVVSVHLDARRPVLHGSIFSGPIARTRQASALVDALSRARASGPVIVAGDFNTLAGVREPAIRTMERGFVRASCGSLITHSWGLPLDHVFASDAGLLSECARFPDRFGSDHHPLIARVPRAPQLNASGAIRSP